MILFKGSAFYFLRLLIQFIIRGNNTFGMGVWYGTVVWDGIFVPYYIPNHRTIPGFTICPGKKGLSSRSPLKRDLAVEVRFYCLENNRDTPSFVVELISILIFNINYQVLTKSTIQDFMVYETVQVYTGWSGRNFYMVINLVLIALFST